MIIKKEAKGVYKVKDEFDNIYYVEDTRSPNARNLPKDVKGSIEGYWGIWQEEEYHLSFINNCKTLTECLKCIVLWEDAEHA